MSCDYHKCKNPPYGPKPGDESWHLCMPHRMQLNDLATKQPFDAKAMLKFWARGHDKDKMVEELTASSMMVIEAMMLERMANEAKER